MKILLALSLLLILVAAGCTDSERETMIKVSDAMADEAVAGTDPMKDTPPDDAMMKKTVEVMMYSGTILAGTTSKVIDFNQADYETAKNEEKTILLYFYANWCPICKREIQELYSAFNDLDNENVIAFRVNYKDSDTDNSEENLAKEYGIAYQHTKIILKNGKQVLKSPDSWDKERYLEEIKRLS